MQRGARAPFNNSAPLERWGGVGGGGDPAPPTQPPWTHHQPPLPKIGLSFLDPSPAPKKAQLMGPQKSYPE